MIGKISVAGEVVDVSTWNALVGKPFELLGNEFVVNEGELQLAETPVKDVIVTQTLTSGVEIGSIEVNNETTVLYAPNGDSINIDNKSLISDNGVIQEAVPVYTEAAQTFGPGLKLTEFEYEGTAADSYILTPIPFAFNGNPEDNNQNNTYIVTASINNTIYRGNWNATEVNYPSIEFPYTYGGQINWHVETPSYNSGYYEFYIYATDDEIVEEHGELVRYYKYQFHCDMGEGYINNNLDWILIENYDNRYDHYNLGDVLYNAGVEYGREYYKTASTNPIVHQLPIQYVPMTDLITALEEAGFVRNII